MFYNVDITKWQVMKMRHNQIDVICQNNKDGTIIPIKIRVQDEEGQYHVYVILSFKELSTESAKLPSEVIVTTNIKRFACEINVFGCKKKIVLHYDKAKTTWSIYY